MNEYIKGLKLKKAKLKMATLRSQWLHLPTMKEQALHLPVFDLKTGLPLRSNVPSLV